MYTQEQAEEICLLRFKRHMMLMDEMTKDHNKMQRINKRLFKLTQNPIYK
jgi:hypothetical protein